MSYASWVSKVSTSRSALLSSAALLAVGLAPDAALAQGAPSDDGQVSVDDEDAEERVIFVTGSRIRRTQDDGLLPTYTLDGDTLDRRGFINVGEALNELPAFGAPSNFQQTGNVNESDVGATFVNLFGLGTSRTLTVVNGKRTIGSASADARSTSGLQVDVNNFPAALIDRVETVSIGGAPVYGSDAIAGTVNIILKDDFEGVQLDLQGSMSDNSDAEAGRISLVAGGNFSEGRGNAVFVAEYSRQEALLGRQRPNIASDSFLGASAASGFSELLVNDFGFLVTPGGLPCDGLILVCAQGPLGFAVDGSGNPLGFNAAGVLAPVDIGDPLDFPPPGLGGLIAAQNLPAGGAIERQRDTENFISPFERISFGALGHYDITPNVRATFRANFSQVDASSRQSAQNGITYFTSLGDSRFPQLTTQNPFIIPGDRTILQDNFITTNAAIPDRLVLAKDISNIGGQFLEAKATTYSIVTGLEGNFGVGESVFDWDFTYSFGRNERTNTRPRAIFGSNFFNAINVVVANRALNTVLFDPVNAFLPASFDVRNFTFDPSAGGYVSPDGNQVIACRARVAGTAPGCLPLNLIGTSNPEEALAYVQRAATQRTEIEQHFIQGNVATNRLFDLPAGSVGFAAGFEYREEISSFTPDLATQEGVTGSGSFFAPFTSLGVSPLSGRFNTKEIFAEAVIPVLSGEMLGIGFERLDLEGAIRFIDNSVAGSDETWTAGARFVVNDSLAFRGNMTRSVRAPAITDFFAGAQATASGFGQTDPCDALRFDLNDQRRSNCIANVIDLGIANDAASAEAFLSSFVAPFPAVQGFIVGNQNLQNEVADSWTAGFRFTPTFIPGLAMNVDWNAIRIENAIGTASTFDIVLNCYDSAGFDGNLFCGEFSRNGSTFAINSFTRRPNNIAEIDFEALTADLRYRFALGDVFGGSDLGSVTLRSNMFYLAKFDQRAVPNGAFIDQVETPGNSEFRMQVNVGYDKGDFSALWTANYESQVYRFALARDNPTQSDVRLFDGRTTHDLSLAYRFNDNFRARAIVRDLFETAIPFGGVNVGFPVVGRTFVLGVTGNF
jgi:outer membrane cobalamin receptor